MKKPKPRAEKWNVRNGLTGKLLGEVEESDIDRALAIARMFFYHNVTVDNLHK